MKQKYSQLPVINKVVADFGIKKGNSTENAHCTCFNLLFITTVTNLILYFHNILFNWSSYVSQSLSL